ncbi:unnamed protein product, partial [Adineta steineri]
MENNAVDIISGLNGEGVNSPTYVTPGITGSGYALKLISSSNQYITISTYQSFVSTSFTIEMWIYPTTLSSNFYYGLFNQYQSLTTDHNLYVCLYGGNLKMGFWSDDVVSGTTLSINTWYHVAFVYDYSSRTQIIYINGVQDISRSSAGPYLGTSGSISIGNYYDGINHGYDGYIDQVTLYMNARNASDILSDATLTTWHSFDCGISYDSGPNKINGTANNVILASGRVGQGLSFSLRSSYYQLYGFSVLGISNHPYSISLWIQRTSTGGGTLVHVSSQTDGGGWCLDFMGFSSSGQIVGSSWDGAVEEVVGPVVSTKVWTHVATTFSTINGVRLYVNGGFIGSTGAMAYAASGTSNTVILGNPRAAGCAAKSIVSGTFYGYLDEFRLYSRELSAREVSAFTKDKTCSDGLMNGDETDTDCGGSCVTCVAGQNCTLTKDCDNAQCTNSTCVAYNTLIDNAVWSSTGETVAGTGSNTTLSLNGPGPIVFDLNNNLYVNDYGNHRVILYPSNGAMPTVIAGNGIAGSEMNQLNLPNGIDVDNNGTLYIADSSNHRIQQWFPGASSATTVAGITGSSGSHLNQLNYPQSVAVDSVGNMYISDGSNYRVLKWPVGVSQGIVVAGNEVTGWSLNNIGYASDAKFDSSGNIYVPDYYDGRVLKWTPPSLSGILVAGQIGSSGSNADQLDEPSHVIIDSAGNIYICDAGNNRIQRWVNGSSTGSTIVGTGIAGLDSNQLNTPFGIAFDSFNN